MDNSLCPVIKELERIYDALAKHFKLTAPKPVITVQTKGRQKNTLGWYSKDRWSAGKKSAPEINICAENLKDNPVETLVHEMVHYSNSIEDIRDCNSQQYHNKKFKERAEKYCLNVEKSGRHGWAYTTISKDLQKVIDIIKVDKEAFAIYRNLPISIPAKTKMKKFICNCTTVRCATDLQAKCSKCNKDFEEEE